MLLNRATISSSFTHFNFLNNIKKIEMCKIGGHFSPLLFSEFLIFSKPQGLDLILLLNNRKNHFLSQN